ncbi:50S ribosomal protein L29 [bacterium]|nr:50S ribosomal protein L29 [bacterium]|tara:strand:+ start:129 stop:305 length:177 start_codon:yes stop_codon:yes gene_type:complete
MFKEKTDKELKELLSAKRKSLRVFRFDIAGSKIKNIREGRNTRREIARVLTEINKRNL